MLNDMPTCPFDESTRSQVDQIIEAALAESYPGTTWSTLHLDSDRHHLDALTAETGQASGQAFLTSAPDADAPPD